MISFRLTQNVTFRKRIAPLIISLTLLFSILIIATTPPATGYELSIYEAYPAFLWILITINIFFSIYTIIRSCDGQSKNSYYGYFSILLIETIILLLPIIRGYFSIDRGTGDLWYHFMTAIQILNSGNSPQTNMYPIMHIWLSILHNFSPDFIVLLFLLSIIFFILYILYLYILGKTILGTETGGIFVSIFGLPLLFSYAHYAFYPFLFALLIVPLILYVYQKIILTPKQRNGFYICLVFLSLFIVFCHPMITIFLLIMFSAFSIYELLKRRGTVSPQSKIIAINIVTIVSITFLIWLFQFRYLISTLQNIISSLVGQGTHASIVESQMSAVTVSHVSIWLVIDRFMKIYGPISLYFSISLIFLTYTIYKYYRYKKIHENDLIYSLQFCVAICIGFALMTSFFGINEPIRALIYGIIFATIMCGLFFYRIWFFTIFKKRKLILVISVTVIITIVCVWTMLTVFQSPWIGSRNPALSHEDKNGMDWIWEYKNDAEIPIMTEEFGNIKYVKYYFELTNNKNSQNLIEYPNSIPSNFGYDTHRTISDSFAYLPYKKVYMTTTEMMKITPLALPVERRNQSKSFTDKDFFRLKKDPLVNLVYSNNQYDVWSINIWNGG